MPDDQPYYGSWFLRVDRFADVHAVCAQNKDNSCVLASIKMVAFKVNCLRPGHTALRTERLIEARYKALEKNAAHDFNTTGGMPDIATEVLNSLGIGNWASEWPATQRVPELVTKYVGVDEMGLGLLGINAAKRGFPVILFCRWKGGGGHAIVCDTVTRVPMLGTYATLCDPWDADVHFEEIRKNRPFKYKPEKAIGLNLWGKVKGDASGSGTIVAIAYCQKSPGFWS
jgi:hypothetical protein